MRYERLKGLERHLPTALAGPLRRRWRWRSTLGDPEQHVGRELCDPNRIPVDVGAGKVSVNNFVFVTRPGAVAGLLDRRL